VSLRPLPIPPLKGRGVFGKTVQVFAGEPEDLPKAPSLLPQGGEMKEE